MAGFLDYDDNLTRILIPFEAFVPAPNLERTNEGSK